MRTPQVTQACINDMDSRNKDPGSSDTGESSSTRNNQAKEKRTCMHGEGPCPRPTVSLLPQVRSEPLEAKMATDSMSVHIRKVHAG